MNKDTFLKTLRKQLKKLKASEIEKQINYYEEILADMMENGQDEKEAIAKIGSPEQIAKEILENTPVENFRKKDTIGRCLVLASMILILFAAISAIRARQMMNAAISIIGGADGPTSIFIAGRVGSNTLFIALAGIVVLVTIVYFIWRRRK